MVLLRSEFRIRISRYLQRKASSHSTSVCIYTSTQCIFPYPTSQSEYETYVYIRDRYKFIYIYIYLHIVVDIHNFIRVYIKIDDSAWHASHLSNINKKTKLLKRTFTLVPHSIVFLHNVQLKAFFQSNAFKREFLFQN